MRVLVVDDDHFSLLAIARPLRKAGYEVVEAMQAEQVVAAAEKGQYGIAIIDIFMPGMGGIQAIQRIHDKSPNCKIIAVTSGFGDLPASDAIAAAKKVGADAGFVKPVPTDELLAQVAAWAPPPVKS